MTETESRTFEYEITTDDYRRFNSYRASASSQLNWLGTKLSYFVWPAFILYFGYKLIIDFKHHKTLIWSIPVYVMAFISRIRSDWFAPTGTAKKTPSALGSRRVRIDPVSISIDTSLGSWQYKWPRFQKAVAANDLVMLFLERSYSLLIPMNVFASPSDAEHFAKQVNLWRIQGGSAYQPFAPMAIESVWPPAISTPHLSSADSPFQVDTNAETLQAFEIKVSDRSWLISTITPPAAFVRSATWTFVIALTEHFGFGLFSSSSTWTFILLFIAMFAAMSFGYLRSSQILESATGFALPECTVRTDFNVIHITSPTFNVTCDVNVLTSVRRILNHVVITAEKTAVFVIKDSAFESQQVVGSSNTIDPATFAKRLQTAIKAGRAKVS